MHVDITIVGGGIVGLSTAYHLSQERPDLKIALLEKESSVALHQSGRNSGVIHSGIYYKPDSLKAKYCITARRKLIDFCRRHQIPYELCGKIILATEESEYETFDSLIERGRQNGVLCREISHHELRAREPHAAPGRALLVEDAGIVDYSLVCKALAEAITNSGVILLYNSQLTAARETGANLSLKTSSGVIDTARLINCAGLYSDRIARMFGIQSPLRIVPFRGEYYQLTPQARSLCNHVIYPVPDPQFPFLGVHLTRVMSGEIECGPNAVLALAREGYDWTTINPLELLEVFAYPGFQKLMGQHWRTGVGEFWRSFSKKSFCSSLQRLVPELRPSDLIKGKSGIRAQAVTPDGRLADDFVFEESPLSIHVLNAPSPAATSSLEIGRHIARKQLALLDKFTTAEHSEPAASE